MVDNSESAYWGRAPLIPIESLSSAISLRIIALAENPVADFNWSINGVVSDSVVGKSSRTPLRLVFPDVKATITPPYFCQFLITLKNYE